MLAANGRVFRLSLHGRGPRQGPGYSASSRSVKSKSLSPNARSRFDGDCKFYSCPLHPRVCLESGDTVTLFEDPFGDSFKDATSSVFVSPGRIDIVSRENFIQVLKDNMKFPFLITI